MRRKSNILNILSMLNCFQQKISFTAGQVLFNPGQNPSSRRNQGSIKMTAFTVRKLLSYVPVRSGMPPVIRPCLALPHTASCRLHNLSINRMQALTVQATIFHYLILRNLSLSTFQKYIQNWFVQFCQVFNLNYTSKLQ